MILQVSYFKYTRAKRGVGQRIFKMAPLHHHYQKLGLHESKIVARFWISRNCIGSINYRNPKAKIMREKLVVLGAGESGVGAAILAKKQGFDVFLSDNKNITEELQIILEEESISWEAGTHTLATMKGARIVVKSPGIPDSISLIQELKSQGSAIVSEIEFASQYTNATLIGITGTNGKTTTTLLTYEILKNAGFNVGLLEI